MRFLIKCFGRVVAWWSREWSVGIIAIAIFVGFLIRRDNSLGFWEILGGAVPLL